MELATLLLAAVCAILLAFVLFFLLRLSKDNAVEDEVERLKRELSQSQGQLRQELTNIVQTSVSALGGMIAENQRFSASRSEERFKTFETTNEHKLDAIRETVERRLVVLQQDNNQRLEEMRQVVDEKLQKTLETKMTQSFRIVSERLEQVYKGLGEMQTLATGVGDLKKVLANVKTRGILGEIQLGAILEEILSPEQYATNVVTKHVGAERVEYAVKLPTEDGDPIYLPIDSKFPGDLYGALQDAYESGSPEQVRSAAAQLISRIKSEAKDIRDKYIDPPYTTEFAVMFLPFEGLYAEVVNRGLLEELQRTYRVNIAGPSTMAALLNSLQMGFRTFALQKRSGEVWQVLGAVRTEFERFGSTLESSQKRLMQVNNDLDQLIGTRSRAIMRKLRDVERMDDAVSSRLLNTADVDVDDEPSNDGNE